MVSRRVLAVVAVIGTLVVIALMGVSGAFSNASSELAASRPVSERIADMMELIEKLGPELAYAEVLKWSQMETARDPHTFGHDFGYAAFKLKVDPATVLSICRTELLFGCLHEFIGQSLYSNGFDYIHELEKVCLEHTGIKLYVSCVHGLGHGLLAYVGYREDDLFKAIEYCDNVFLGDHYMACHGGIYMEYNERNFIGESPRRVLQEDPYDPCVDRGRFTLNCVYWLPLWWGSASSTIDARMMMDLCTGFPGTREELASCYEGVGRTMVARSPADYPRTAALCDDIGKASDDAWLGCRWTALRDYKDLPEEMDQDPTSRCIGLLGEKREFCIVYMQQKIDAFNETTERLLEERVKVLDA